MVDPKVRELGERLRLEEIEFIDFPAIAERCRQVGIPTSVRTLRFYVNEGILPPPQKQGKTPVYPERHIIHLLLSIHLMKSRFQRSLAEIKAILGQQREAPEVLADKCTVLYEDYLVGDRLPRVAREWLVDSFFRTLTGKLMLYPLARRHQPGPRQAGEVLLREMVDEIEHVASWQAGVAGEPQWCSPEEVILEGRIPQHKKEGARMDESDRRTASRPQITPLDPPEGSTSVDVARRREELFLERFERNLARVQRIYNPLEKKQYSIRSETLDPEVDDPYQKVVSILKEHDIYDRKLLESLPHDRSTRYTLPPPGLFGRKKPRLVISGIVRSPIASLARLGGVIQPLGLDDVQRVIGEHVRDAGAYHVLGVLSTVGWNKEVTARMPRGEEFAVVLVEQTETGGWQLHHTLPESLRDLLAVFEPEDFSEKVSRAFYRIIDDPDLKISGGYLLVDKVLEDLVIDEKILEVAMKQVTQENPRISLTEVAGKRIVKRART